MLQWLISRFRRRWADDDPEWVMKAGEDLTDTVMPALALQLETAGFPPEVIPSLKQPFVAGYIAGFCDVIAQASGAKPGGSLSMTLSGRVMQRVFGNVHGDHMFGVIDRAMRSDNRACQQALSLGASDANLVLRRGPAVILLKYLSDEHDDKILNVSVAVGLASNELLLGRFDKKEIEELAVALSNGPMPYSTHDLAAAVAVGLLRKVPQGSRKPLFDVQLQARMAFGSWVAEGKLSPLLAEAFEQTLYKEYHPERLN